MDSYLTKKNFDYTILLIITLIIYFYVNINLYHYIHSYLLTKTFMKNDDFLNVFINEYFKMCFNIVVFSKKNIKFVYNYIYNTEGTYNNPIIISDIDNSDNSNNLTDNSHNLTDNSDNQTDNSDNQTDNSKSDENKIEDFLTGISNKNSIPTKQD